MKKPEQILNIAGGALLSAILSLLALPALAQINAGLEPLAATTGLGTGDIRTIVGRIIYVALGILGTVLLVIIIYAGFLWMTAGGNEERVATAKKWIVNAVIGLAIILASYAITYFIITQLLGATTGGAGGPGFEQGITTGFGDFGTASLGEGIIQSVYPSPGATGIVRNTKVIVTFKLPIDPATVIAGGALKDRGDGKGSVYTGTINLANARLVPTSDLASGGAFQTSSDKLVAANGYTVDNQTFVFAPVQYLGTPNSNVSYTAALGPGIMLADGKTSAFSGNFSMGYHWEFETNTTIDLTPPQVVHVTPDPGTTVKKNIVIEITFNEGVDPTSATGPYTKADPQFSNVTVTGNGTRVEGTWEPSNQYKTISFRTNVLGGTNSCGDKVYVLPGGVTITVTGLAATVGDAPPQSKFYPPDGITDLAGNSLDGNANGKAEGSPADNVTWKFTTTDALDLTPPKLDLIEPGAETGNADLGKPVAMTFDKQMSIATLTNSNLVFDTMPQLPLWYFGEGVDLDASGAPVKTKNDIAVRTQALIDHERLAPTVGKCSGGARAGGACAVDTDCPAALCTKQVFFYYPKATSGVTDIYQNCFLPACGADPTRRYCCPSATGDVSCPSECKINATSGRLYCDETASP